MPQVFVLYLGSNWESFLQLVEFTYNNRFQATISKSSYEALHGKRYISAVYWDEVGENRILGLESIAKTVQTVD